MNQRRMPILAVAAAAYLVPSFAMADIEAASPSAVGVDISLAEDDAGFDGFFSAPLELATMTPITFTPIDESASGTDFFRANTDAGVSLSIGSFSRWVFSDVDGGPGDRTTFAETELRDVIYIVGPMTFTADRLYTRASLTGDLVIDMTGTTVTELENAIFSIGDTLLNLSDPSVSGLVYDQGGLQVGVRGSGESTRWENHSVGSSAIFFGFDEFDLGTGYTAKFGYSGFAISGTSAYAPVPEPSSLAVLGLSGLALLRRKRAK